MAFKLASGASGQLLTKGIVFIKGLTTTIYWSSVNAYRVHGVFENGAM